MIRPPSPDTLPAGRRRAEGGVVLILTLFVILITYALVTQLTLSSTVAYQTVRNAADRVQMEAACRSAAQEILDVLSSDASGEGGDMPFGGGGATPAANAAPGGAAGDSAEAGGEEDDGSNSDSWEDAWARPMRIVMGDIEITAWAQDENGKFNLLSLLADDEDYRKEARERCVRILDRLREDVEGDLTVFDAERITREIVEWLEGKTRSEEIPRPLRRSNPEEEDWSLPFSLEELLMLEDVDDELYYDQIVDDDLMAYGLESVFTVWTAVKAQAPSSGGGPQAPQTPVPDQPGAGTDLGTGQDVDVASTVASQDAAQQTESDRMAGQTEEAGVGVFLNLNTAPKPVLLGFMDPAELPEAVVHELLEYRNEEDEEALRERESMDSLDRELEQAFYGRREEVPKLYLHSLDDLSKLDSFEGMTDPVARQKFLGEVGVQSDVFSIYLFARKKPEGWLPERRYEEPPGPVLRLRAVVQRRAGQQDHPFVVLLPWHEVPFTRWRIPDFQDRLEPFVPPEY